MRLCGRGSSGAGCLSLVYSTYGISYSHVCGRVIGYEYNSPDPFSERSTTIDSYYVDASITHGAAGRRQHIRTFVAGYLEPADLGSLLFTVLALTVFKTKQVFPNMWEITISVIVGTLEHHHPVHCIQVTHSGMVRAVDPLPAVS